MKEKLLISACFCGKNTKYNGGNNLLPTLEKLKERYELILVCPEVMGGLQTPRDPSEIQGEQVFSNKGKDVTEEYLTGARKALEVAMTHQIHKALLKESSPSCGSHFIFDGTFSGKKIRGEGMTVRLLKKYNIQIYSENQIEELLK